LHQTGNVHENEDKDYCYLTTNKQPKQTTDALLAYLLTVKSRSSYSKVELIQKSGISKAL
jgi:hypothetical protein